MFEHIPTYDKYRTLEVQNPMMSGEDIYALQQGMRALGSSVKIDGYFGSKTDQIVRNVQRNLGLSVDGKAGGATQKSIAMVIAFSLATAKMVPQAAVKGQLEHESGFRLGIYSPARDDGTYDAGVAQRNTKFILPEEGFNPRPSVEALVDNTRKHFNLFEGVHPQKRRWTLAQGAWNAPAFACYIAREEGAVKVTKAMIAQPSTTSRQTFEEYMEKVSKYLKI